MRSRNFRDSVLWAICYKLGLDPAVELLEEQAAALASSINAWVRRLYPAQDNPEWTFIESFVPINHVVGYDTIVGPRVVTNTELGRIFKVYLVDPRTTPGDGLDTPHKLLSSGIHVGFEHGPNVWIKYQLRPPQYTAKEWDSSRAYLKDELTYSPDTGEVYKSKVSRNLGHDPSGELPNEITTEVVQQAGISVPDSPVPHPKILEIIFLTDVDIPDPHPAGAVFDITINDAAGAILGNTIYSNISTESLASIINNLVTQLTALPGLASFTITADTVNKKIRFENDSEFNAGNIITGQDKPKYFHDGGDNGHVLKAYTVQPYVPTMSALPAPEQITELTLVDAQVAPAALYTLLLRDQHGFEYSLSYTAGEQDSSLQILIGLADAIGAAAVADPTSVWANINSSIDTATAKLSLASSLQFSMEATFTVAGSPWWDLVPFPEDLVDQVVRGVYADALKAEGQSDKGAAEEQLVPVESQAQAGRKSSQQYNPLTDQEAPRARYSIQ